MPHILMNELLPNKLQHIKSRVLIYCKSVILLTAKTAVRIAVKENAYKMSDQYDLKIQMLVEELYKHQRRTHTKFCHVYYLCSFFSPSEKVAAALHVLLGQIFPVNLSQMNQSKIYPPAELSRDTSLSSDEPRKQKK